ncbi:ATP-binding protein [Paenibacillus hodogayensis]
MLQASPGHVLAVGGQLDLRGWDPASRPTLSLYGQWELYPYQLLTVGPENAGAQNEGAEIVNVPGLWRAHVSNGKGSPFGYGSYRLRIQVEPDSTRSYSIRVPVISTSSALFVNGQLLAQSGRPAETRETYTAGAVPYSASFTTDRNVIDIVFQVANYDDSFISGIRQSVQFGTEAAIDRSYWFSVGTQLSVCLILLMHAVYSLILYAWGARQKALLYFSALTICAIVTILIDDDRILPAWFPVSFEWTLKLYYLSFLGVAVFLLHYVKQLLPPFPILRAAGSYSILCGLYALLVLFLPGRTLSHGYLLHIAFVAIPFFVLPVLLVLAIRRGVPDIVYLALGATAINLNLVWGIIKNVGSVELGYYPFDMLAAFTVFALYWFKRYFRISAQTAKQAEQLQAADKLKDEFLMNTSHELRNPLHSILNIAQTVLESNARYETERIDTNMKLLIDVGKRMSYMLNDLTDLTRLKENRIRLHPVRLRVQTVASGVLDMVRFMTEGKPVRLVNNVPNSLPPVLADENRLIQILFNLLHNAVKFTNVGQIRIDAWAQDGKMHIRISDTGIGIDKGMQKRIFTAYEQGDADASSSITGLGLGLTISRRLVELHAGTLTVESAPNRGSAFTFSIPLFDPSGLPADRPSAQEVVSVVTETAATAATADDPESAVQLKPADEPNPAEAHFPGFSIDAAEDRPRILAIDDDPVNLHVLAGVLSRGRYDIATVTSGPKALALLDSNVWDLIITDVMMPGMSGYEVARIVRSRFSHSELPILLLTARSRPEDIEAGFRSGANDYITKPVDALELRSRVRALTEVTRTARERIRMEAAWLQAQIQPHFLFNTLNSVAALSEIDTGRMQTLLVVFGNYLRASFDFRNSDRVVPLHKELELVRAYLFIEKERFESRIQVVWEVNENLVLQVPPLSIQPLVENAVRHGVLKRARGGTVQIRVAEETDYAEITVQDDGIGMDEQTMSALLSQVQAGSRNGVGLANTNRRLMQLYGEGLRIESAADQGTVVTFRVKK